MRQKEKNSAIRNKTNQNKAKNKQTNKPIKQNKTKTKNLWMDFYALRYYREQNEICVLCLQENHHLVDYNTAGFANS